MRSRDQSARRKDRLLAELIIPCLEGVFLAPVNLEIPKPDGKKAEDPQDERLKQKQARARRLLVGFVIEV